ncbi:MAG: hypothetical protein HGB26_08495 [Desulfobulbaceae bacterium]|nr:hypothetical protein [Desulfobulbaceae bacterium]
MRKILTDEQIGENLRAIIEAMGLTQDEFAEKIGKNKTHISGYIGSTGGRKAKNLLPDLITLGINGLWYLTGEGQMFNSETAGRNEDSLRYEQIGRAVCNLVEMLGPEIKKSLGTFPDEDEMLAGLMSKVNAIKVPGPAPDLTEDEIEELSRRQCGHNPGGDEE